MANLSNQRKLASKILDCGLDRVWMDPAEEEKIAAAITREDIRGLISEGVIKARKIKGVSRGRARLMDAKRKYGHRKGPGSRKGKKGARTPSKELWMKKIRALRKTLKAARADGISLIVCSPYRDIDRQTMLFSNKVNRYMGGGMSYMDAYNLASQAVTVPGSSEHQIGLAVDIITADYTSLDEGFGDTPAGKWLAENSCKYGFILRYPQGKEEITSIEYEPWHFRYVGTEAATVITENDICLEEFWNMYVE